MLNQFLAINRTDSRITNVNRERQDLPGWPLLSLGNSFKKILALLALVITGIS